MANETDPSDGASSALTRRLATILSCDVAGYSRMMGENEEATVRTLRAHRAVFDALLKQHHGRVFNTAGDAILAEFPSAVEAVRCATEIQSALQTRNEHLPLEQKMLFRMGINVGDVVIQDGDLLGDGVNVAARIQTVAEPGGICISGSVYDQIQNKLSLQFRPLGDQKFKNIGQPIRTFTITHGEAGALPAAPRRFGRNLARAAVLGAVAVSALAAGGFWLYRENEAKRVEQSALAAELSAAKQAAEEARRAADEQSRRVTQAESKAERERSAVESANRDKELQAKAQSVEEAQRRASAERKQLDEEKRRLEAEKQASAATLKAQTATGDSTGLTKAARKRAMEERQAPDGGQRLAAVAPSAGGPAAARGQAVGKSQFDGIYTGQLCNFPGDPSKKTCWSVPLNLQGGAGNGTWSRRLIGKPASLHATIGPGGTVAVTLDSWSAKDGAPLTGALTGHVVDNHIDIDGRWANGLRVDGHWTRTP
jgi:class 3 adenylate cyclase